MIVNWRYAATADYWQAERLILHASNVQSAVRLFTANAGSYDNPIAIYSPDASGNVNIDVTDYVRTYGAQSFKIGESSSTTYTVAVTVRGLINPRGVIIPTQEDTDYAIVVPPFKIINNAYDWGHFGFYSDRGADIVTYIRYLDGDDETDEGTGEYPPECEFFRIEMEWAGQAEVREITRRLLPRMCDAVYAEVRWIDFMGQTRCHTFEVVKQTIESDSAYSLLNINNEYEQIKGRVDGFTIKLEDLCKYDIWYYSDLLTSSKVEISLGNQEYYRVEVTNKSVTLPDGENSNGKVEFNINYRKYDPINLQ